jgi:hypothetical protein
VPEFFRKNDGSGYNRTRQSTAASLVDPGNTSDANGAEFFLITKSTAPIHFVNLAIQQSKSPNEPSLAHRRCFLAFTGSKII